MMSKWFIVILALSCSAPPPRGPEPAGVSSKAFVGASEIEVRYRYQPKLDKEVVLHVDVLIKAAGDGNLSLAVEPQGFVVVTGQTTWREPVDAARTATHSLTLRATSTAPSVAVVTRHAERGVELARDEIRFTTGEDGLRECQSSDC